MQCSLFSLVVKLDRQGLIVDFIVVILQVVWKMGENLFYVSRADIFQIYPRVLKELLIKDDLLQSQLEPGKNMILLPSGRCL